MELLRTIILGILLVVSVLMIAVVLMQQSKESGLGSAFGGSDEPLFSSKGRSAGKEAKLRKITIALAVVMGVMALIITALPSSSII